MANLNIGIKERPKLGQWLLLSLQHVFAMFGATVLVPLLTGLDIGVALVASGVGTLIYIICTRGKVPVYLGSSFAYIGAISTAAIGTDFSAAYVGLMVVGLIYATVALIIRFTGSGWLKKILPPVVVGPMIIIIGLSLAPTAIEQSGLFSAEYYANNPLFYPGVDPSLVSWAVPLVAIITFLAVVGIAAFSKGFFKIIPFILAIVIGYAAAMVFGLVPVEFAFGFLPYPDVFTGYQLFQIPNFTFLGSYDLNYTAILTFAPLAFVTLAEHIGDHSVLGEICEEDFITDPGLDKTILGDGIATFVAAAIGGPANTTLTGVLA